MTSEILYIILGVYFAAGYLAFVWWERRDAKLQAEYMEWLSALNAEADDIAKMWGAE